MRTAPTAVFKSLADPTRRAIFERLSQDGEQTVRTLTERSGVSQPAVSKHLGVLRKAGLVRSRHSGRETHYTAHPPALAPMVDWMSTYSRFWQNRINRLESLLDRMKR